LAAVRERAEHVVVPVHAHLTRRRRRACERDAETAPVLRGHLAVAEAQNRASRADVPVSDRGQEIIDVVDLEATRQLLELVVLHSVECDLAQPAELLVEQLAPLGDVLVAALALEPLADLLAGARRLY